MNSNKSKKSLIFQTTHESYIDKWLLVKRNDKGLSVHKFLSFSMDQEVFHVDFSE